MIAASDSSDRGDGAASSISYEELFSVLMYYGHMSYEEIMTKSRRFLYAIYHQYPRRACENLGVSADQNQDEDSGLSDKDYPSEFISFTQAEREKAIEESGETDEEFISKFDTLKKF